VSSFEVKLSVSAEQRANGATRFTLHLSGAPDSWVWDLDRYPTTTGVGEMLDNVVSATGCEDRVAILRAFKSAAKEAFVPWPTGWEDRL
jgi:hypothetical protein